MCKYCGKNSFNEVCPSCIAEQNAILWDNDECVDLNSLYGLFGLLRFAVCLSLIIVIICGFKGFLVGNLLWVSIISLTGGTFFFHRLRKMYHNQLAIVIDREMRKNHS